MATNDNKTQSSKSSRAAQAAEKARSKEAPKAARVTDESIDAVDQRNLDAAERVPENLPDGLVQDPPEEDDGQYMPPGEPMDNVQEALPLDDAEANQFGGSSDPIAEVTMPAVKTRETEAGTEIRPAVEPRVPFTREEVSAREAAKYGVHSGRVGHTVPIVDDFTPSHPQAGGLIGGEDGYGAIGRVKAEQKRDRAARAVMDNLLDGAEAKAALEEDERRRAEQEGKTAYRVLSGGIFTANGKKVAGQKAYLSQAEAQRFSKMGRIAPWFDDEE